MTAEALGDDDVEEGWLVSLEDVKSQWDRLGREDPLWAVLTNRGRGGRWDVGEFLATGVAEISALLDRLDQVGIAPVRETALDFGCGAGRLTQGLARAGFRQAIGVDVSPSMIARARELNGQGKRCTFVLNERADLGAFPTASVDLVYSSRVLQHMPQELAHGYIREFVRVAKPGAVIVFQIPNRPANTVKGVAVRLLSESLATRLRRGMQMHATPDARVRSILAEAGARVVGADPDRAGGSGWVSHRYLCLKPT